MKQSFNKILHIFFIMIVMICTFAINAYATQNGSTAFVEAETDYQNIYNTFMFK